MLLLPLLIIAIEIAFALGVILTGLDLMKLVSLKKELHAYEQGKHRDIIHDWFFGWRFTFERHLQKSIITSFGDKKRHPVVQRGWTRVRDCFRFLLWSQQLCSCAFFFTRDKKRPRRAFFLFALRSKCHYAAGVQGMFSVPVPNWRRHLAIPRVRDLEWHAQKKR